jgi:hypothetical protein
VTEDVDDGATLFDEDAEGATEEEAGGAEPPTYQTMGSAWTKRDMMRHLP